MVSPSAETLDTRRAWLAELTVCAAAGVVLGIIGPFGSFFNDGVIVRIVYWTTVLLISGLILGLAVRWTWPRARRAGLSVWMWAPIFVLVVSLAPALVSRILAVALWPGIRHAVGLIEWYGQAMVIGLIYVTLYVVARRSRAIPQGSTPTARTGPLPRRLDRSLVCLQMEDHYVRVHSDKGSELLLMSLAQAIAALDGVEGLQTHRSWWVARSAVTGLVEDGRNIRLTLSNGLEAPVSRARVAKLRAAGWLQD